MLSSEITRELQSLTQTWRNYNFVFTGEQRKKYDRLLSQAGHKFLATDLDSDDLLKQAKHSKMP